MNQFSKSISDVFVAEASRCPWAGQLMFNDEKELIED